MGHLGRATGTVHSISVQTSQEGIKCTKAKELTVLIFIPYTPSFLSLWHTIYVRTVILCLSSSFGTLAESFFIVKKDCQLLRQNVPLIELQ